MSTVDNALAGIVTRLGIFMVSCMETGCSLRSLHYRGNVNNTNFGICVLYIRLNNNIIDSDFVMQGLDNLIYGSDRD